jgi:hypothetical protein
MLPLAGGTVPNDVIADGRQSSAPRPDVARRPAKIQRGFRWGPELAEIKA